jgi:D-proline reductase (dithiol) PrdB
MFGRVKNRLMAKLFTRFPILLERVVKTIPPWKVEGIPWAPFTKDLRNCKIAIVTTAGVHLKSQPPFNMKDPNGDPSFREIPGNIPNSELMITHDYYDHRDADKDINIVFPIDRLREMKAAREIEDIADVNFGFMGHIDGPHIYTLINETAPEVAKRLKAQGVDVVLLTPG